MVSLSSRPLFCNLGAPFAEHDLTLYRILVRSCCGPRARVTFSRRLNLLPTGGFCDLDCGWFCIFWIVGSSIRRMINLCRVLVSISRIV